MHKKLHALVELKSPCHTLVQFLAGPGSSPPPPSSSTTTRAPSCSGGQPTTYSSSGSAASLSGDLGLVLSMKTFNVHLHFIHFIYSSAMPR